MSTYSIPDFLIPHPGDVAGELNILSYANILIESDR